MNAKDIKLLVSFFTQPKAFYTVDELTSLYEAFPGDGRPVAEQLAENRDLIEASPKGKGERISRENVSEFLRQTRGVGTPRGVAKLLAVEIDGDVIDADEKAHEPVLIPLWLVKEIAWEIESLEKDASALSDFVRERHGFSVAIDLARAVRA
ncbi:MAG: hypothetical protein ACSLFQ_13395 [Thermoanaerobaculia bacterium]